MKLFLMIALPVVAVVALAGFFYFRSLGGVQTAVAAEASPSFYGFVTETLEGEPVKLSKYSGQVALVVNVASKCGLTPQYEGLEKLYQELAPRGFVILGFPSNDFMGQEPGTPAQIREFCSTTYGVSFPLFAKRHVKGDQKDEIYSFLTANLDEPDWNFTKYLVDPEGRVLQRFGPRTKPDDAQLREAIEQLLAAKKDSDPFWTAAGKVR